MTKLNLIGAYRVEVSDEERRLITERITLSAQRTLEEIGGLALLEIEVKGAHLDFDVGAFHQDGSDQAPYDERYFSLDGMESLGTDKPDRSDFRVCFFLHYFDPSKAIKSGYDDIAPTELTAMPQRLARVCVYEHPG